MMGRLLLDAEQGHERDDAALPVVVDPHGEVDVFHGRDEEERPQDQRQRAERRLGVRVGTGVVEDGLERVERARADVAEHDAERREAGQGCSPNHRGLIAARRVRHAALHSLFVIVDGAGGKHTLDGHGLRTRGLGKRFATEDGERTMKQTSCQD